MRNIIFLIIATILFMTACGDNQKSESNSVNEDNSSNEKSIKIGTQIWTIENLKVTTFINGDEIPQVKSEEESKKASEEKRAVWCYYQYDSTNDLKYGKLYNWYAIGDPRGLAPKGWHVATDEEWTTLTNFLGGENIAGNRIKNTSNWNFCNETNGNGDNRSGFSANPGGSWAGNWNGYGTDWFSGIGTYGAFWTATESDIDKAWYRSLGCATSSIGRWNDRDKTEGLSVRCVKD